MGIVFYIIITIYAMHVTMTYTAHYASYTSVCLRAYLTNLILLLEIHGQQYRQVWLSSLISISAATNNVFAIEKYPRFMICSSCNFMQGCPPIYSLTVYSIRYIRQSIRACRWRENTFLSFFMWVYYHKRSCMRNSLCWNDFILGQYLLLE